MAFSVELTVPALRDMAEAIGHIARDSPERALKWRDELLARLSDLADQPMAYDLNPEASPLGRDLRSFNHYSHRVIYEANEGGSRISVIRLYHGSRAPLKRKDLR